MKIAKIGEINPQADSRKKSDKIKILITLLIDLSIPYELPTRHRLRLRRMAGGRIFTNVRIFLTTNYFH